MLGHFLDQLEAVACNTVTFHLCNDTRKNVLIVVHVQVLVDRLRSMGRAKDKLAKMAAPSDMMAKLVVTVPGYEFLKSVSAEDLKNQNI